MTAAPRSTSGSLRTGSWSWGRGLSCSTDRDLYVAARHSDTRPLGRGHGLPRAIPPPRVVRRSAAGRLRRRDLRPAVAGGGVAHAAAGRPHRPRSAGPAAVRLLFALPRALRVRPLAGL